MKPTTTYVPGPQIALSLREQARKNGTTVSTNEIVKILDLKWDPSTDTLTLSSNKDEPTQQLVTKRNALQVSSKVYDPLGLLPPVTIRAKLLIQELWQQQLDWDEPLSPELSSQWHEIAITSGKQLRSPYLDASFQVLRHSLLNPTYMYLQMPVLRPMELSLISSVAISAP